MFVEFLKSFSSDLDDLKVKSSRKALQSVIVEIEKTDSIDKIPNIKKLKGHKTAYRIRVGDYRLGLFYENGTILLARFRHRKDIYRLFP